VRSLVDQQISDLVFAQVRRRIFGAMWVRLNEKMSNQIGSPVSHQIVTRLWGETARQVSRPTCASIAVSLDDLSRRRAK